MKNTLQTLITDKLNRLLAVVLLTILSIFVIPLIATGADARTQWQEGGVGTSSTPVFNEFYDVPGGVGDEAEFVRIKPAAGTNADYVNSLADLCNDGSAFTIRTYVHNGGDPSFNEGDATAIARNTVVAMNVNALNEVRNTFTFSSTISADNAASMTDTATLDCDQDVVMRLVPSTVQTYSRPLGFQSAPDSAVNGSLKIGSRVQGSGDVLACWEDRVIIVYEVVVEKKPEVVINPGVCDLLELTVLKNRQVRIDDVRFTANDATVNNIVLEFGDGTSVTISADKSELPYTHTYSDDGQYNVRATVNMTFDGSDQKISSDLCAASIKVTTDKPPVQPPAPTPTTPTTLPVTGAGSIAGLMAVVAGIGSIAHRKLTLRRQ